MLNGCGVIDDKRCQKMPKIRQFAPIKCIVRHGTVFTLKMGFFNTYINISQKLFDEMRWNLHKCLETIRAWIWLHKFRIDLHIN